MRSLAHALGCSPMKTYRYFENRDELFALVRIDAFDVLLMSRRQPSIGAKGRETPAQTKRSIHRFRYTRTASAIMFQLTPVPQDYQGSTRKASEDSRSYYVQLEQR